MRITRRSFTQAAGAAAAVGALGLPGAARAERKLVYGNAGNPQSSSNTFARKWLDAVTEKTKGELVFDVQAGTLGGEKQILDGTSLGTVDIYNGAYTGTREFDIFYAPYFVRDYDHALKAVYGLLNDKLQDAIKSRYDVTFLTVGRAGPWNLFTNQKMDSFADLKGMKIRAPEIEGVVAGLKQLGAKPTVIPFNEVYTALQQGVVDGMATLGNLGITQKFYEVVKYVYKNDWGLGLDKQMINNATWSSFTPEQKDIFVGTFKEVEPVDFYGATVARQDGDFAKWEEFNGAGTAIELDPTAAQKLLEPVNAKLADEIFGAGTWDKLQAL